MQEPEQFLEIFLQPGEHYFGDYDTRIRTLLGSCVSMTFWHPTKRIGGMNHIMLPKRSPLKNHHGHTTEEVLNGKYADESILLMIQEMKQAGTKPSDYQVKIFGGGDMFSKQKNPKLGHIGRNNVEATKNLLHLNGFKCHAEHLGGLGHRYVIFDIWSGDVWLKHEPVKSILQNESVFV